MKRRHVQSSIVIPIETNSRNSTIEEMKKTEKREDVVRNKRLFGNLLLGTLSKFRKEETSTSKASAQVKKLSEIDKRLERTKEEDREALYAQKQEMFAKRREEEVEVKKQRRQNAIEHNAKEKEDHFKRLQNFIQTRAKPPIFYLPAKPTPETDALLAESSKSIEHLIEKIREDAEKQLKGDVEDEESRPKLASRVVKEETDEEDASENGENGSENGKVAAATMDTENEETRSKSPVDD